MKCFYCSGPILDEIDENYRRVWRYYCVKCDLYYDNDPHKFNKDWYSVPPTKSGKKVRNSRANHNDKTIWLADKPAPYCLIKIEQIKVDDETHKLFMEERSRLNKELKQI